MPWGPLETCEQCTAVDAECRTVPGGLGGMESSAQCACGWLPLGLPRALQGGSYVLIAVSEYTWKLMPTCHPILNHAYTRPCFHIPKPHQYLEGPSTSMVHPGIPPCALATPEATSLTTISWASPLRWYLQSWALLDYPTPDCLSSNALLASRSI